MNRENTVGSKKYSVYKMVMVAMFGVLAAAVMYLKFPLAFLPSFYKLDMSEAVVLVGSFALGPVAGVIIELLKNIINLLMDGTSSAFIGEASNFVVGCALVVPATLIYQRKRTFKSAIAGCLVGLASMIIVSGLFNYYILIPAYNMPIESIIGSAKLGNANSLFTFVLLATVPFNLIKGTLASVITLLIYKRVEQAIIKPIRSKMKQE